MTTTKNLLIAMGAFAALSFTACNDGVDTSEAVGNDIEAAADRASDAVGDAASEAGDDLSDMRARAGRSIDEATNEIQYEWNDESRDLYGDMREAGGYIDNRMSELKRDMSSASAEAKAKMQTEYNELEVASKRMRDDVDNWSDRVGNNFSRYATETRNYLGGLDLDVDLDDNNRDYDYN